MKRPIGQIVIEYDPNTGKMGYQAQGLTVVEVAGLLNFVQHQHLNKLKVGMGEDSKIVVASGVEFAKA